MDVKRIVGDSFIEHGLKLKFPGFQTSKSVILVNITEVLKCNPKKPIIQYRNKRFDIVVDAVTFALITSRMATGVTLRHIMSHLGRSATLVWGWEGVKHFT